MAQWDVESVYRRVSVAAVDPATPPDPEREVAKLVDLSRCTGCKACEVACKQWNDLPPESTYNFGSYQSHRDLTAHTWLLIRFNEVEADGELRWLIKKDSCLHCEEPGCLLACPAEGAIVQYRNGIVDFNHERCIGCGYCIIGCPFNIPRMNRETRTTFKCTLCPERVTAGLEPACVKTCPTEAIRFGTRAEMVAEAEAARARLHERGFAHASVYDPAGVGGTHMLYVVPHGDLLEHYPFPARPTVGYEAGATLGRIRQVLAAVLSPLRWLSA